MIASSVCVEAGLQGIAVNRVRDFWCLDRVATVDLFPPFVAREMQLSLLMLIFTALLPCVSTVGALNLRHQINKYFLRVTHN